MANQEYLSPSDLRPISFKINPKLYNQAKYHCFDHHMTMKKFIEQLLVDFFEKNPLKKYR